MIAAHVNEQPTIAGALATAAAVAGDAPWLTDEGRDLTFGAMHARVVAVAAALVARGVTPGDRVAVWAPNTLEAATALLAIPMAGATVVPLNTRYRLREVAEIVESAGVRLIMTPGRFLHRDYAEEARQLGPGVQLVSFSDQIEPGALAWSDFLAGAEPEHAAELADRIAAQTGDEIVVVQYTSGTTGRPKGALLRQAPMLATARTWAAVVGLTAGDVAPITYPLAHVGGFKTGLLTTLLVRARALLLPVVDADALVAAMAQYRVTILSAPPPVLRTILDAVHGGRLPRDTSVRTVITGSAPVPPALVRELADVMGVQDVINGYGLTEATGVCTMTRRGDAINLVCETIGRPIDGVQVRVAATGDDLSTGAAVGELEVRGANVMVGYLDDPAATAEVMHDGWLRTGDVGHIDPDGYVRISGRSKDLVIVGGFNVYPAEVESVLAEHPALVEAAVVGVPDDRLGEVIAAFVVLSPGAVIDAHELIAWCAPRLANYKVPRFVWAVRHLPRGAVGKVAKAELRARALATVQTADP